jgi:isoleucyl-tRNA synthetase
LHRLWEIDKDVRARCEDFDFHGIFTALHNFCAVELSAFYFDVRKDSLYCDPAGSLRRRAARTVLDQVFECLTAWLAPFLSFTADEAWLLRHPDEDGSVHLHDFPTLSDDWKDDALAEKWSVLRNLRRVVTGALEIKRADKTIGSSLQASVTIFADENFRQSCDGLDMPELFITSEANFAPGETPEGAFSLDEVPGVSVVVDLAGGEKCARCWQVLADVGAVPAHADICTRCADAVDLHQSAAE